MLLTLQFEEVFLDFFLKWNQLLGNLSSLNILLILVWIFCYLVYSESIDIWQVERENYIDHSSIKWTNSLNFHKSFIFFISAVPYTISRLLLSVHTLSLHIKLQCSFIKVFRKIELAHNLVAK